MIKTIYSLMKHIKEYNQFVNDPTVKQYAPGFNPIQ